MAIETLRIERMRSVVTERLSIVVINFFRESGKKWRRPEAKSPTQPMSTTSFARVIVLMRMKRITAPRQMKSEPMIFISTVFRDL